MVLRNRFARIKNKNINQAEVGQEANLVVILKKATIHLEQGKFDSISG